MFQRILLIGGSGQVGTALRALAPPQVRLQAPTSRQLDIRSRSSVQQAFAAARPQLVINAAAYTAVDQAEDEPHLAYAVNATGPALLAEACATAGCPMLHLSTDYVFDGAKTSPYLETDPPAPLNVYGASKLQGEQALIQALPAHLILRVSWVFSATGHNFVKTMLGLAQRCELSVVDDQRGAPTAAHSIAAALWSLAGQLPENPSYGLYHLGAEPATTWHGFASAIFSALAQQTGRPGPRLLPIPTSAYPSRARRPRNTLLNGSRLQRVFSIAPPSWPPALQTVLTHLLREKGKPPDAS